MKTPSNSGWPYVVVPQVKLCVSSHTNVTMNIVFAQRKERRYIDCMHFVFHFNYKWSVDQWKENYGQPIDLRTQPILSSTLSHDIVSYSKYFVDVIGSLVYSGGIITTLSETVTTLYLLYSRGNRKCRRKRKSGRTRLPSQHSPKQWLHSYFCTLGEIENVEGNGSRVELGSHHNTLRNSDYILTSVL